MLDVFVILVLSVWIIHSNRVIAARYGPQHASFLNRSWNYLFVYHLVFSCLFPLLPGDAIGYWNFGFQQLQIRSDRMMDYFGVGTVFLLFLDFIPVKVLGLSFLTGNILYGMLGFIGIRYIYRLFLQHQKINVKIAGVPVVPFLFYLPNMNFWTSGVGKDTLCFFGIACFIYGLQSYGKRMVSIVLSFAFVYCIRPHVGMMMIGGLTIAILFSRNVKIYIRALILLAAVGAFILLYGQVAKFLKVDDLSVKSLMAVASDKAAVLSGNLTGSGIDISNYPWPLRLLTYLYRPLFFDVHNLITFFSSVENLVYIVITFLGIRAFKASDLKRIPLWMTVGFFIFLASLLVFSNSLGNLGIIMRMKNMTMIYFLIVLIWFIGNRQSENATHAV